MSSRPLATTYVAPSSARALAIEAMMSSLFAALESSLENGGGDLCRALEAARAVGCALQRLRDSATGRWFVHGFDTTATCELPGRCWTAVRDALLATWGAPCKYNGCTLGPSQSIVADSRGAECTTTEDAGTIAPPQSWNRARSSQMPRSAFTRSVRPRDAIRL